MLLNLPASSLKKRKITADSWTFPRSAVFPMFTSVGKVQSILIISCDTGTIHLLPAGRNSFRAGFFGSVTVKNIPFFPGPITDDDLHSIKNLWHYDPWWLLEKDIFSIHPFKDELKATNCVNIIDKNIQTIFFTRDFTTVAGVLYNESQSYTFKKWNAAFISGNTPATTTVKKTRTIRLKWTLDPIWNNW